MDAVSAIFGLAFIAGIFVMVVVFFRIAWRTAARQAGQRQVLEYGRPLRALGIFVLAVGLVALFGASRSSPNQRLFAWILAGGVVAVGIHTCLKIFLVRVEFDDSFIYTFSPWRQMRQVSWADVLSCRFSKRDRCFILRTRAQGELRVPIFLSGIKSFAKKVDEKGCADQGLRPTSRA